MVSRVLEQQKAIAHVLSQDKVTRHLIPSWQDIDVLEAIKKTLGPLVEFTDALSGEKYVSVSFIKPALHLFNNLILAEQDDDTDLSKCIKRRILEYLNEKYGDSPTQELLDNGHCPGPKVQTEICKRGQPRDNKSQTDNGNEVHHGIYKDTKHLLLFIVII